MSEGQEKQFDPKETAIRMLLEDPGAERLLSGLSDDELMKLYEAAEEYDCMDDGTPYVTLAKEFCRRQSIPIEFMLQFYSQLEEVTLPPEFHPAMIFNNRIPDLKKIIGIG